MFLREVLFMLWNFIFLMWSFDDIAVQIKQILLNTLIREKNLDEILLEEKLDLVRKYYVRDIFLDMVFKSRPMMPSTLRNVTTALTRCILLSHAVYKIHNKIHHRCCNDYNFWVVKCSLAAVYMILFHFRISFLKSVFQSCNIYNYCWPIYNFNSNFNLLQEKIL